jgi:hypothetical protein
VIPYVSRTGTISTIEKLRRRGWRILVTATGRHKHEGLPYAIDNGAWTAFQQNVPFNADLFRRCVKKLGKGADWIVVPDIVAGALESLDFSASWIGELRGIAPLLIAVQDGMTPDDLRPFVAEGHGIFVGGSTEWKLESLESWGELKSQTGCHLHVARVNSVKRILRCQDVGADSIDGTSVARFPKTLAKLDNSIKQQHLWQS